MDRAAHAMLTAGVTTVFHPLVYAKTLIQVHNVILSKLKLKLTEHLRTQVSDIPVSASI